MPHVTGLGHIDWDFTGQQPEEVMMIPEFRAQIPGVLPRFFPSDGAPTEGRPFWWYPDWDLTFLHLLLRPERPLPFDLAALGRGWGYCCSGELLPELLRFRKLLDLAGAVKEHGYIEFAQVEEGILVHFAVKGRVRSPGNLMRAIVRKLS